MEDKVYFFMDLFALTIVIFMLVKVLTDPSMGNHQKKLLRASLICEIAMFSVDALNNLTSVAGEQIFVLPVWINTFCHFSYFLFLALVSRVTFLLIDSTNDNYLIRSKTRFIACFIPSSLLIICAFVSMFTGWMYTISPESTYSRGPLNFVQMVFPAIYIIIYLVVSIHHLIDKHYYPKRKTYRNILIYCFAPILGGTLQFIFPNVPFLIAGIVVATLMMYVHIIQNQVSTDYLTGLHNRSTMDKYLNDKIKNHSKELYLLMMDIDYFKTINDTFGHVEGDQALKEVGNSLKKVGKKTDQFVARFGGDEFAMILEIEDNQIKDYIDLIKEELEILDSEENHKYKIRLSIGYAKLSSDIDNVPSFIAAADKMLYQEKLKRN